MKANKIIPGSLWTLRGGAATLFADECCSGEEAIRLPVGAVVMLLSFSDSDDRVRVVVCSTGRVGTMFTHWFSSTSNSQCLTADK